MFNDVIVPQINSKITKYISQSISISTKSAIDSNLNENVKNVVLPSLKNIFSELVTQVSRSFEIGLRFTLENQMKQISNLSQEGGDNTSANIQNNMNLALETLTTVAEKMSQHIVELQTKILNQFMDSLRENTGNEPHTSTSLIEMHLENRDFKAAFAEVLSMQNLEIFSWLLTVASPEVVLNSEQTLCQDEIIAIVQQASCCLAIDPEVKIEWLQYLLCEIDESHIVIKKYGKAVLLELSENLKKQAHLNKAFKPLIYQVEKKTKLL